VSTEATPFDGQKWDTVITPPKGRIGFDLKELLQYKYLMYLFVKRDFTTQYKQTILGPLWFLIQPLMTTGIYTIVFGGIANIPTDNIPQPLFYIIGITFWTFFQSILTANSGILVGNAGLFGKVYFPRMAVPIATSLSQLYKFAIQALLMLVVFFFYVFNGAAIHPNWWIFAFPLVMLQHGVLGLGLGLWASAWTVKYRDLSNLIGFGMSLWMWATPIVYPISQVTGNPILKTVIWLNPVAPGIELVRYGFTGAGSIDLLWQGYGWLWSLGILLVGLSLFQKAERTYVDVA